MQSLSPNAQEFVPYNLSQPNPHQQPLQPIQTYLIDPATGATSPIVHMGYQNQMQLHNYLSNFQLYKPNQHPSSPVTQYSYYPNQQIQPLQLIMPTQHMQLHQPNLNSQIPQQAFSPPFNFHYQAPSQILTSPPPIVPGHVHVKHGRGSMSHVFEFVNNFSKQDKSSSNPRKQQQKQIKPSFKQNDEKDWPSLNNTEIVPKVPYIADEAKFKKVVKNVNFIKQTIEQHYLYETNQNQNQKNNNPQSFSLSFKDAVLTKPVKLIKQLSSAVGLDKLKSSSTSKTNDEVSTKTSEPKAKRNHKRRKSKTNAQSRDSSLNNKKIEEFELTREEFPDLSNAENSANFLSHMKSVIDDDAYSSDATLDAIKLKSKTLTPTNINTSLPTKNSNQSSTKRAFQPITIEFANMISALERGQKDDQKTRLKSNPMQNLTRPKQNFIVNSLDSTPSVKRGKEREKPKNKKKSTLKKIILREREEKRKLREVNKIKMEDLSIDINSPIPNLSDLFKSPKLDQDTESIETNTLLNVNQDQVDDEEDDDDDDEEDEDEEEDEDQDTQSIDNNTEITSPISQHSPISLNGYTPSPYASLNMISSDRALVSLEKLEEQVKQKIHSRKFREYCNQIINKDIDCICSALLHEIVRFQDRLYHKNPIKAKMKRRYVMGIREVTKHLKLQKLKCVILAPNCEKIESKGGLDDAINFIIQTSMEQNIPFLFALGRKGLGKAVNKLVPISVIGIFDYSGAEEYFKRLVEMANNAKLAYQDMVEEFEREECENLIMMQSNVVNNPQQSETTELYPKDSLLSASGTNSILYNNNTNTFPKIPSHMAHSRTPSNGSNISIEPFYQMNYHTHSRSASGNFNYGHTTLGGHSRSASGGGGGTLNIDLGLGNKHWTHSRTPSNCSNISFISRLSEPISEVGGNVNSLLNANSVSAYAAVQYYTEQVRQEMRECESMQMMNNNVPVSKTEDDNEASNIALSSSLVNLHLGCISEIDAGNEADVEDLDESSSKTKLKHKTS